MRVKLLDVENSTLLRLALVLAVLALSAYLGRMVTPRLALLVAAGMVLLGLLARPLWGLVALIPTALCVPLAVGTGTQTSLNAAVLLVAALLGVWLLDMLRRGDVRLVPSPVNLPAASFAIVALLAFAAGQLPWNPFASTASLAAQAGGLATFILSVGALLLVGNMATDLRWLRMMVWLFLGIGALVVLTRWFPSLGVLTGPLIVREGTGCLFWLWLTALAGGLALFDRTLPMGVRVILFGLALGVPGVGWFLGRSWASGWFPPLVVLGVLLWLRSWRLGLVVTLLAAVWFGWARPDLPADVVASDQYSLDTRRIAWDILLRQVLPLNPVLGLGPSNYYHYTPLYPILGWYVKFNSHNQYVDILAQTGVLGMGAFLWLMAALGRLGWRLRGRVGEGFAHGYVHACLAGLAGTLVAGMLADWFIPFVYNIGLAGFRASVLGWLFLGGLVALEQMKRDFTAE
ncbi:MAG: O-antigen ligase family protein [Anaerolineae bacterium]